jgi:hypothetical protein
MGDIPVGITPLEGRRVKIKNINPKNIFLLNFRDKKTKKTMIYSNAGEYIIKNGGF